MNRIPKTLHLIFVILFSFFLIPSSSFAARPEVDTHLIAKWTSQQYPGMTLTLNSDYTYETTPYKLPDGGDFSFGQGTWESQGTILCLHADDSKYGRTDILAIFTLSSDNTQISLQFSNWDVNIFKFTRQ